MERAIVWSEYQELHITTSHDVSYTDVREIVESLTTKVTELAEEEDHPGTRYRLTGRTAEGRRLLVIVTKQLDGDLFPVTAYEPTSEVIDYGD